MENELYHHGIKGQKWGRRNGPPYPLESDQRSAEERKLNPRSSGGSNDSWGARNGLFSKKKKVYVNGFQDEAMKRINESYAKKRALQKEYEESDKKLTDLLNKWGNAEGTEKERLFDEITELGSKQYRLGNTIDQDPWLKDSWGARNGLFSNKKNQEKLKKEYYKLQEESNDILRKWEKAEGAEKERLFDEYSKKGALLYDTYKMIDKKSWGSRNGNKPIDFGKGYVSSFGVRNGLRKPRTIKTKSSAEWDLVQAMDDYDSASWTLRNMDSGPERDEYGKKVDRLRKERNAISEELFGQNYFFNNRWQQLWNDDEKHGQSDW